MIRRAARALQNSAPAPVAKRARVKQIVRRWLGADSPAGLRRGCALTRVRHEQDHGHAIAGRGQSQPPGCGEVGVRQLGDDKRDRAGAYALLNRPERIEQFPGPHLQDRRRASGEAVRSGLSDDAMIHGPSVHRDPQDRGVMRSWQRGQHKACQGGMISETCLGNLMDTALSQSIGKDCLFRLWNRISLLPGGRMQPDEIHMFLFCSYWLESIRGFPS